MPSSLGIGRKYRYTIGKVLHSERMKIKCNKGCCSNGYISQEHAAKEIGLHVSIIVRTEAGSMPHKVTYEKMINWLYKRKNSVEKRSRPIEISIMIQRNYASIFRKGYNRGWQDCFKKLKEKGDE